MNTLRIALSMLVLAVTTTAALADRSRLDDESDVVDGGDCELELAVERTRAGDDARERGRSMTFGCGIGWGSELALGIASARDGSSRTRITALAGKTALRSRAGDGVGLSLAWAIDGQREAGSRWRRSGHVVALEATRAVGSSWLFEAVLGAARDRVERRDALVWSLGVERALGEAFEAKLEWSGSDRERPTLGAALRWEIWPDHALLSVSYERRGGPVRERQVGVAVTFEF